MDEDSTAGLCSLVKESIGSNLFQMRYSGLLLAPILYASGKGFKGRQFAQRIASLRDFDRRDMNESHSVLEPKRGIAEPGGFLAMELLEYSGDVAPVLRTAICFNFVSHHDLLHELAPSVCAR
jgi:hypothetical protein